MKVTLKDGSVKEYAQPMSVIDIAKDISEGLARAACAGELNGEVVDLRTVVDNDCELNILTFDSEGWRSSFPTYNIPYYGPGVKTSLPGCKTGNRTVHFRWFLL